MLQKACNVGEWGDGGCGGHVYGTKVSHHDGGPGGDGDALAMQSQMLHITNLLPVFH